MPRCSVIVPVYNVAAFLPQCVDSILGQSEPDIEIILVDDGSTDECPALLAAYAARDARVRVVTKANGGLSDARNAGMDAATGEYLLFVDADDWVDAALVADACAAAGTQGAQLVLWNYRRAYPDHVEGPCLPMRDEVIALTGRGLTAYFYRRWFPYVHGQEAWCRLYRRDIVLAAGLRFVSGSEVFAEDTLFSAMYLLHVRTLAALARPYTYYRQRPDGLMGAPKPRLARRLTALAARFADYAAAQGQGRALRRVLPVFFYRLVTKGISRDPDPAEAALAMAESLQNPTVRALLHGLLGPGPLLTYLLRTGRGLRTQWRGRAFARAWLRGDVPRAMALVERIEAGE
ncbi:MAG: glycosyltransferase [Oscillospiraceae bacterium]|jgi:glycosyltransferase involved in cell wall biosynthesis|nr:glycosyltransferase [Oscillospiraceae bacterium]